MTIEQAIIYIMQNANDEQKQWASDVILGKKEISQEIKPKDDFFFPTFRMGGNEFPSRAEIYDEVCERHLKDWTK